MHLIITRTFPPDVGGMQNLMWGLARSLSKFFLIKVFADHTNGFEKFDNSVSFSIERVSGVKLFRKYRKSYLINEYLKQNNNVQCLIADHWKSLELIQTNKKKICLIHSKEINHPKGSRLNTKVLKVLNNVDHVIANSHFTKDLAINLGIEEHRILVINPGVDPVKEIPSICIGYGDEEENLKKLVIELKLEDQVKFLKDIPSNFKNALISKSNVFIMPSIIYKKSVEGFGIAYVEAAQYGIPSIGGKDGGASDAIIHEKTGLICDGNNLDDIYSSIDQIFKENKYFEYGKAAYENSKNFHWDKIIESYKRIL